MPVTYATSLTCVKPERLMCIFFPLSAPLRTWFHAWSWSEHLVVGATTFVSLNHVSEWVRAVNSSLDKHLGRHFSETLDYLCRGGCTRASHVMIRFLMRYRYRVQLKLSMLCGDASSLRKTGMSAARPQLLPHVV